MNKTETRAIERIDRKRGGRCKRDGQTIRVWRPEDNKAS
jgi:hypothetical protein